MTDRPRYSHRRQRYYDDEESDTSSVERYPPPRPRQSDNRRPPPPAPAPQVRRPSILVDPDETPSERAARRPRANSNVRLQTSDDDDNYNPRAVRARRAAPPQMSPRHDLEGKNTDEHRRFRAKRDGYESDEGENLRQARKAPPPPRGYGGDEDDYRRQRRPEASLPLRGKPRDPADGVEYGDAEVPAAPRITRRRTYKDPSARDRRGYDDYDAPPPRRPERRRTNYDDPGYHSDHVRRPPPRRERPRRDYDDYDDYDRPRRRDDGGYRSGGERPLRPRPQDYYSDYREDRAPRRGDPSRRPRDDWYDDRRRDDDRLRPSKKHSGMKDWQKEAGAAFMAYALPVIKKEGPKYVKKELQKFLEKRASGGV